MSASSQVDSFGSQGKLCPLESKNALSKEFQCGFTAQRKLWPIGFKYRNKIGMDVAIEALRECRREKKCSADQLWRYARICRVANVMPLTLRRLHEESASGIPGCFNPPEVVESQQRAQRRLHVDVDALRNRAISVPTLSFGAREQIRAQGSHAIRSLDRPTVPAPEISAYPKETVIAEKLEAMVALGRGNSRMKDYADIQLLSRVFVGLEPTTLRLTASLLDFAGLLASSIALSNAANPLLANDLERSRARLR